MFNEIIEFIRSVPFWDWIIIGVFLITLEILLMIRYYCLAKQAKEHPIIVIDHMPEKFKESAIETLEHRMIDIQRTFCKMREEFGFQDAPVEMGKEFCSMMVLSSSALNLNPPEHPTNHKILEDDLKNIKINVKYFEAPLNSLLNVIVQIINSIPAPYRKSYLRKVIHVNIVSLGEIYEVMVHKNAREKSSQNSDATKSQFTNDIAKSKGEIRLFKETAFMILELHGNTFKGLEWRGMMHFTDGLNHLIKYLKKPDLKLLTEAKNELRNAIDADPEEYEACCFLGALEVARRTRESNNEAIKHFEYALKTDREEFKAFVHAGLSHCYAQQYHRFAKRTPEVAKKASKHANTAANIWQKKNTNPQPWITYTQALTLVIDEGINAKTSEDLKKQFIPALNLCLEAIGGDDKNKLFYNTLGWILLKLTEKNILELKTEDGISEKLTGNVPEKSEYYLKKSLDYSKENKLSNANLCLLYATSYYRDKSKKSSIPNEYYTKCISRGKRAIEIDPNYINGYRDLAVSLIRYEKYDEALEYYKMALEKAKGDKDYEIMVDVLKGLKQMNANNKIIEKFRNPPQELLTTNIIDREQIKE